MKLVKCNSGHFYDEEKYESCPHCSSQERDGQVTVPVMRSASNDAVTVAMNNMDAGKTVPAASVEQFSAKEAKSSLKEAVKAATEGAVQPAVSGDKTIGFFSHTIGKEPVVGWLVCVQGPHFGEDFKLKSGRNFIGRAASMDVSIAKDTTVSREKHGILVYEPKGNIFLLQPGDSKELCYLNEEVVLSPKEIKVHDRLSVGATELMFIPCCTSLFNWDMVKKETQKD